MVVDYALLQVPGTSHPLYLSSRPGFGRGAGMESIDEFTAFFREAGVATIMVLITAPEISADYGGALLRRYRKTGFRILHCPIEDFSVPDDIDSFGECIDELWKALHHAPALMHCAAGLGRTGLTAACLLIRGGLDWKEALSRVRDVRPGAAQTVEQEDFIARYARFLRRGRG
jgi:protein-tyrosine phosphatase